MNTLELARIKNIVESLDGEYEFFLSQINYLQKRKIEKEKTLYFDIDELETKYGIKTFKKIVKTNSKYKRLVNKYTVASSIDFTSFKKIYFDIELEYIDALKFLEIMNNKEFIFNVENSKFFDEMIEKYDDINSFINIFTNNNTKQEALAIIEQYLKLKSERQKVSKKLETFNKNIDILLKNGSISSLKEIQSHIKDATNAVLVELENLKIMNDQYTK